MSRFRQGALNRTRGFSPNQKVTRVGLGSRLVNSLVGVLIGIVIFIGAFPLLFWNESRTVRTARTLLEGRAIVKPTTADAVLPELENALVHLTGVTNTPEVLQDEVFGIAANAIGLRRNVEMYQWKESSRTQSQDRIGGSQEQVTTYSYERVWSDSPIRSAEFWNPAGHENPSEIPFRSAELRAELVNLGAYHLDSSLVKQLNQRDIMLLSEAQTLSISRAAGIDATRSGDWFYLPYAGGSAQAPSVGDMRIRFEVIPSSTVSVVAQQQGSELSPYPSKHGATINLLAYGEISSADMFATAEQSNRLLAWALRLAGFMLMTAGLGLLAGPLVTLGKIIPPVGALLGLGVRLIAGVLALVLSTVTIALAWVAVRPVFGIALLLFGAAVLVGAMMLGRKRQPLTNSGEKGLYLEVNPSKA